MKNIVLLLCLAIGFVALPRTTLKLTNGATLYTSDTAQLYVYGSLVCEGEDTRVVNDGEIRILSSNGDYSRSDILNNASDSLFKGEGDYIFAANVSQVIGGSFTSTFKNLTIDNFSDEGVILATNVFVGNADNSGHLNILNGRITDNNNEDVILTILNKKHDAIKIDINDGFSFISTKLKRGIINYSDTNEYIYPIASRNEKIFSPIHLQFKNTQNEPNQAEFITIEPLEYDLLDTLVLSDVVESKSPVSFFTKLFPEMYYKVDKTGASNASYDLYMRVDNYSGLKQNKYGIVSQLPSDNKWRVYGKLDPKNTKYRDFNSSNYVRRTEMDTLISKFALASLNDLEGSTKVKKMFSNKQREEGFVIEGIEQILTPVTVSIYNHWGSLVYQNTDYQNAANEQKFRGEATEGMYASNEVLPNGTYFYVLETQNAEFKSGYIHLQFFKD
jgi:hypothetical protein